MWSLFTTLSSWFTELQCAYNYSQSFPICLFLDLSLQTSLLLTTGNHWCRFLLWFLSFQAMASIWSCILPVTPVSHFLPSVSPLFTPLFSWMPLRVRGQRSGLFKRSPDFCLFVFSKSVAILESIQGVGVQDDTRTDGDKGSPKWPWFPSFYSLQHILWQSSSLQGWHILRNLPHPVIRGYDPAALPVQSS